MNHSITQYSFESILIPVLVAAAVFNALLPAAFYTAYTFPLGEALSNGFGHSFVIWLVLILALKKLFESPFDSSKPSTKDIVTLVILALLIIFPSAILSWVIAALVCLIWLQQRTLSRDHKIVATIIFALSLREPICQLMLTLFADQILSFDAWYSNLFLSLYQIKAQVIGNSIVQENGYSLLILTGCSAFTNLSLAILLWFTLTLLINGVLGRNDFFKLALLISLLLLINGIRLSLMSIGHTWYLLLHEGETPILFEILTILIAIICVTRRKHHEDSSPSHSDH